jgi:hypothetical protein
MITEKLDLSEARYVKLVVIGGIDPNNPVSEEKHKQQVDELNKMLSGYPKGTIIGKDTAIGTYMIGEHELVMDRTTYHVGFPRKPEWINEYGNDVRPH